MSLDSLLAKLEARIVTPVTDSILDSVTLIPKQTNPCTLVTFVTAGLTESELEQYEERAAIIEFDGGLTRQEAEKQAKQ